MRVASGFVALVVLVGTLTMLGCGGDDDGDNNTSTPPAPGSNLTNATASNLANRVFTFPNGFSTNPPTLTGLPPGQTFTPALSRFRWHQDTALMTLESAGNIASGTVSIGSCIFQVNQSTFPASQGPLAGMQFTANPCQIDTTTGALILTDPRSGQTATSSPSTTSTIPNVAFVLTTDFATGSYSVVDLATRNVTRDISLGGVHSDAIARFFSGRIRTRSIAWGPIASRSSTHSRGSQHQQTVSCQWTMAAIPRTSSS